MTFHSNSIRLLLLVFMLVMHSFQLAVAASSFSPEPSGCHCPDSSMHQAEMSGHHEAMTHGCCEQGETAPQNCSNNDCCKSLTLPTLTAIALATSTASRLDSENIKSLPSRLSSRYFAVELRPPRA
jgi:hypothetical protein